QAEDGIRDRNVTGVQTCALPILKEEKPKKRLGKKEMLIPPIAMGAATLVALVIIPNLAPPPDPTQVCLKGGDTGSFQLYPRIEEIGRASCRERVQLRERGGSVWR